MGFLLVVMRGRSKASAHRLAPGVTVVGRQEGCQLQVKSSQVSRRHCELTEKDGKLLVKDLGSSNGTFVNGQKVEGTRALEPGDTLTLGNVTFRIERSDVAGAARKAEETAVPETVSVAESASDAEVIPLSDDQATVHMAPPAAKKTPPPPPKTAAARQPAAVPAAGASEEELVEVEASEQPEIGEDAVAEFLLNIELDDEDKV
jgi:predicted component of type VI protein secretion system